ncbi:putative mitochondrial protein [Andalucia godoyi]|uniref:Putative mitochondrial protein n=1 Tax=Andalucia godoyi TaxID=505711 RepID=A0A8K0F2J7_ANDGO|nr:putative mitochondrial protein [Andalucia godoyi]|eukprot:ANDGO_03737.mRNA.1 putative mitochondrial protein
MALISLNLRRFAVFHPQKLSVPGLTFTSSVVFFLVYIVLNSFLVVRLRQFRHRHDDGGDGDGRDGDHGHGFHREYFFNANLVFLIPAVLYLLAALRSRSYLRNLSMQSQQYQHQNQNGYEYQLLQQQQHQQRPTGRTLDRLLVSIAFAFSCFLACVIVGVFVLQLIFTLARGPHVHRIQLLMLFIGSAFAMSISLAAVFGYHAMQKTSRNELGRSLSAEDVRDQPLADGQYGQYGQQHAQYSRVRDEEDRAVASSAGRSDVAELRRPLLGQAIDDDDDDDDTGAGYYNGHDNDDDVIIHDDGVA